MEEVEEEHSDWDGRIVWKENNIITLFMLSIYPFWLPNERVFGLLYPHDEVMNPPMYDVNKGWRGSDYKPVFRLVCVTSDGYVNNIFTRGKFWYKSGMYNVYNNVCMCYITHTWPARCLWTCTHFKHSWMSSSTWKNVSVDLTEFLPRDI